MILLTLSLALADIPPPEGRKVQLDHVRFTGLDEHPGWAIVVFPFSTSNGAPEARAEVVRDSRSLELGHRVIGTPEVWIVSSATADSAARAITEASYAGEQPDPVSYGLWPCGFQITDRSHMVSTSEPGSITQWLALAEASPTGCRIEAVSGPKTAAPAPAAEPAPAPAPAEPATPTREGAAGCAAVGTGGGVFGVWLAAAALVRRRR